MKKPLAAVCRSDSVMMALVLGGGLLLALAPGAAAEPAGTKLGCFISTGDNHWLGEALPIDSPGSIEAGFDLLARLGVRRVYWRGLEEPFHPPGQPLLQ